MKIILSLNEAVECQEIMDSVDEKSSETFIESVKDNCLVSYTWNESRTEVAFEVNIDYMVAWLRTSKKFIKILVSQIRSLYETYLLMVEELEDVLDVHLCKGEKENARN